MGNCDSQIDSGKGHSLARSWNRRRIQVPHIVTIPIKAWLIAQHLGSYRVFFDVAFLGADNMCVAQRFRSKMKCLSNVHSHAVFCAAGSAHCELSKDYA